MAHPSVDLVEEDAADLQFPKDPGINSYNPKNCQKLPKFALEPHRLFNQCNKDVICNYCGVILSEPFIMCAQCSDILLCLYCFATGKELRKHKNFHAYFIQHDNFALFSSKWTAQEEKLLLDSILRFGYGNWEEIAKFMETKSADECEKHYLRYYVDSLGSSLLPKFKDNKRSMLIKPYLYNLECLDEPPRYQSGTIQFNMLAGYRPARNEFDYPYDANAETILNNINYVDAKGDKPLDKAIKALHCGVVRAYNHRLMERWRRYNIMRTHGLVSPLKISGWLAHSIKLYKLRENGIKSLAGGTLYRELKEARNKRLRECPRHEDDPLSIPNLLKNPAIYGLTEEDSLSFLKDNLALNPPKRKHPPLDIIGMPGYEKLNQSERDLCKVVRLIPEIYIQIRDQLIAEYRNTGCLRLGDARRLIKIDVNKTRQVYDYLINEGFIKKP